MNTLKSVMYLLITTWVVYNVGCLMYEKGGSYGFVFAVWRRFRLRMLAECLMAFAATYAVGLVLYQIPLLRWGWASLLLGMQANILLLPVLESVDSTSWLAKSLGLGFMLVLIYLVPFMAIFEEKMFRKGHEDWPSIAKQSIKFGFAHCLVGIPLAIGAALTVFGFFYAYKYKQAVDAHRGRLGLKKARREAVMVSTAYHSLSNTAVFSLLVVILLTY